MNDHPPANGSRSTDPYARLRLVALIAAIAGVVVLAAGAFVFSYQGIHDLALSSGVSPGLARFYPVIFDAMLVVACAAVLSLRGAGWWRRGYSWLTTLVLLAALALANAVHATGTHIPRRPSAATVAVLPWVLLLLAFSLLLSMLRQFRYARTALAEREAAARGLASAGEPRPAGAGEPRRASAGEPRAASSAAQAGPVPPVHAAPIAATARRPLPALTAGQGPEAAKARPGAAHAAGASTGPLPGSPAPQGRPAPQAPRNGPGRPTRMHRRRPATAPSRSSRAAPSSRPSHRTAGATGTGRRCHDAARPGRRQPPPSGLGTPTASCGHHGRGRGTPGPPRIRPPRRGPPTVRPIRARTGPHGPPGASGARLPRARGVPRSPLPPMSSHPRGKRLPRTPAARQHRASAGLATAEPVAPARLPAEPATGPGPAEPAGGGSRGPAAGPAAPAVGSAARPSHRPGSRRHPLGRHHRPASHRPPRHRPASSLATSQQGSRTLRSRRRRAAVRRPAVPRGSQPRNSPAAGPGRASGGPGQRRPGQRGAPGGRPAGGIHVPHQPMRAPVPAPSPHFDRLRSTPDPAGRGSGKRVLTATARLARLR